MKRILALLISSITLLPSSVYAESNNVKSVRVDDNLIITKLSKDSLLFIENGKRILVSSNGIKTEIKNLDTGNCDYFKVDLGNNAIYSSITGKTLLLPEMSHSTTMRAGGVTTSSDGKGDIFVRSGSVTFSYLQNMVGASAGYASIAAAISLYPGIGFQASVITNVLNGIAIGTMGAILAKSPNGKLKWDIYNVEVSHVKNGQK